MDIGCPLPTQGPVATAPAPVVPPAAAAVCPSRARLGASVFILGHRHPVLMAKMLTSIDALSNGRLICGVGVGWWKEEIEILGGPFHGRGLGRAAGGHARSKPPAGLKGAPAHLRAVAAAARRPFESIALSIRYSL